MDISAEQVRTHAQNAIFGTAIVDNRFRPLLVEAMVDLALGAEWEWCAKDWAGYDFQHKASSKRLEVKQSAKKQSWHKDGDPESKLNFDIKPRKGLYEGTKWTASEAPMRNAEIYLFAAHELTSDQADHRDPQQWRFFILRTQDLPGTQTISIDKIKGLHRESKEGFAISEIRVVLSRMLG